RRPAGAPPSPSSAPRCPRPSPVRAAAGGRPRVRRDRLRRARRSAGPDSGRRFRESNRQTACRSPPLAAPSQGAKSYHRGNRRWRSAMKVIDAQIHIWSKTVVPPSGLHRKVEKFTAEEALTEMDEAGVDAALIHPPYSWDPDSNALAVEAAKK